MAVVAEVKFAPLMVSVNAGPPATAELGLRLVIVDAGLMVRGDAADVPPGVVTVTLTVPAAAIWAAVTGAVNWVALLYVTVRAVVFHFAVVEPETKFAPLMVSVNAAPPATTGLGLKLEMVGGE